MDYHIRCAYCSAEYVVSGRGFWVAPKFPPMDPS
jgi:hypothetical protein